MELRALQELAYELLREFRKGETIEDKLTKQGRQCVLIRELNELQSRVRLSLLGIWLEANPLPPLRGKEGRKAAAAAIAELTAAALPKPTEPMPAWTWQDRLKFAALVDASRQLPGFVPDDLLYKGLQVLGPEKVRLVSPVPAALKMAALAGMAPHAVSKEAKATPAIPLETSSASSMESGSMNPLELGSAPIPTDLIIENKSRRCETA